VIENRNNRKETSMTTVYKSNQFAVIDNVFYADASDLRFPVGAWPQALQIVDPKLGTFIVELRELNEATAVYRHPVLPHAPAIVVCND
jgi:hypothetical protein